MLNFILSAILILSTAYSSWATDVFSLSDYEREGIRNRYSPIKQSLSESEQKCTRFIHFEDNKKISLTLPKDWDQIEKDMISTMGQFRKDRNEPLSLNSVITRLKGDIKQDDIFKTFCIGNGIFDNDQMECLRRRCLIALKWEEKNKTKLVELWLKDKKTYGEAIVEILNTPIVDN